MLRFTTLAAALAVLATTVSAQTLANGLNYSTSGPLEIDISQVPLTERDSWCVGQRSSCPSICGGRAYPNMCDPTTLNWTCTCTSGATPNISDYDQTIPSFVCATWRGNCVDNQMGSLDGNDACLSVQCGSKDASGDTATTASTTTSSVSSTSSASTGAATTPASTSPATATKTGAATALHIAESYGSGIIASGLLALFGLML